MREKLRFLGLDVHAETITAAIVEADGEVRSLGTIANREDSIRKFIRRLGSPEGSRSFVAIHHALQHCVSYRRKYSGKQMVDCGSSLCGTPSFAVFLLAVGLR